MKGIRLYLVTVQYPDGTRTTYLCSSTKRVREAALAFWKEFFPKRQVREWWDWRGIAQVRGHRRKGRAPRIFVDQENWRSSSLSWPIALRPKLSPPAIRHQLPILDRVGKQLQEAA